MIISTHFYSLLILCGLMIVTYAQQKDPAFMEKLTKYREECIKQEGVDMDYLKKVWTENHFPTDNPKLKCYFKCMNLKLGVMNEKGDVIDDVLKKVRLELDTSATASEIVVECGAIEGADLCETAFKLMACIRSAELD